jgi:pyruvate formate lyase activating enzyme
MSSCESGMVLDIVRFSLHDGPGIRTTIFLKGCPLSCKWCHNPESQSYKPQLSFDSSKCTNCLDCIPICPTHALSATSGKLAVSFELCNACGDCVQTCPTDAFKIYGRLRTTDDVISIVLKDLAYYKNSGGGMTISGGEPMAQFKFTLDLLKAAKRNGVHTCVETCGYAPTERFSQLLDYVDIFLYDYKETDPVTHKRLTGVSNRLILKNLDFLYNQKANIILRCPIIPGINDTEEHLSGIRSLYKKYPNLGAVEILPYHNMGKTKAERIGATYELRDIATATREQGLRWVSLLRGYGYETVRMG